MSNALDADHRPLLEAIAFAGRAHQGQTRKDKQTPYVCHVFRVALIVRHVFGLEDDRILTAAILHDTVEDTTTDFDDLQERFGAEVAGWVALLSKDKRLPDDRREAAYCAGLAQAPWQVKVCKLADIYDNLTDSAHLNTQQRARTILRTQLYLDALASSGLTDPMRAPWECVQRMLLAAQRRLSNCSKTT